ncbi:hypothetical protein C9374_012855 [Naegleria lovaniensis]|uniref:Flavin reductase like domain-containing protein n=1 Tax=Naegleria lovaniensis TaxID=51637 RepID=A0AA88GE18_NAELO|nr:uncharacterized protein C9374_012855 [Naegleria lovaniensis]KAG2373123.1 hypothetical protein C9374_012855 [Naegleria lovaniensis]
MKKANPSCVIVYRPFGASFGHSALLPSSKLFVPNDEQQHHHGEVLEGEYKSIISKNGLRRLLFTFLGYGDGSLKLFLTHDHHTDHRIENNKVKIFKFTELLKGLSSIDGMMVLENVSSRHHKQRQTNDSFSSGKNTFEGTTFPSMMTIHSFTLLVISKFGKAKSSIIAFKINLQYACTPQLPSTDIEIENTLIEIVPDTSLLPTKSIVGLDILTTTTAIKKKVTEKYLVAITTDNHVWIWHEKNLDKLVACMPLPDIESSELVLDFSILALHDGSQMLCTLTSSQSLLFFKLNKNDTAITLQKMAVDEQFAQQDISITCIHTMNNLIVTHFKNKLAHVISLNTSHVEDVYKLELEDVALLHFTNRENFIFYHQKTRKLTQCLNGIQHCIDTMVESESNLRIFCVTKDGNYMIVIIGSWLFVLKIVTDGQAKLILKCDILNDHSLLHEAIIGNSEKNKFISVVPANLLSRLLYTNPVCLLTSSFNDQRNIMTITWLTPVDNSGHFVCSMNTGRHSASLVLPSMKFALSVPTTALADTVLAIGGCSGSSIDKFEKFVNCLDDVKHEQTHHSPRKPLSLVTHHVEKHGSFYCFSECCAHLCCVIEKELERTCPNHHLFYCRVVAGFVKQGYWQDGKMFVSNNEAICPPYLTFVGSQQFAKISNLTND